MKLLIVGLGNQGQKRIKFLKKIFFATYDPYNKKADYGLLKNIPLENFDSVFLCVPDNQKYELAKYFLYHKKNIFIEKPLFLNIKSINFLYNLAKKNKCMLYSAYNHRFEPNILRIKKDLKLIKNKIYHLRLYYGNGTAKDVNNSRWRDSGLGVISDLNSHLLDILIFTLGFKKINKIKIIKISKYENKSPDHSIITFNYGDIFVEFETSLCSWKNSFRYDLYCKSYSFHIDSLFKWGKGSYIKYSRTLPSGNPKKLIINNYNTIDPTWSNEHNYLKKNINLKKNHLNTASYRRDILISNFLNRVLKLIE